MVIEIMEMEIVEIVIEMVMGVMHDGGDEDGDGGSDGRMEMVGWRW